MLEAKPQPAQKERRYETRDFTSRAMVYSAFGFALLTLVGLLVSWLAFRHFVRVQKLGPPASPFENTRELPPAPRLQIAPAQALKAYLADEQTKLESYGWVDRQAGIVRIPIDRAMKLSLERGFPVRTSSQGPAGHVGPKPAEVTTSEAATRPASAE